MVENSDRGPSSGDISHSPQRKKGPISTVFKLLTGLAIIGIVICLLLPAVRSAREPARRNQCANHLKQIALALHTYAATYGALPPAHTVDPDGKPLHSWRTLILPYLEEGRLYKTIDLAKPWDDPANAEACKSCVGGYECPSTSELVNRTTYLAIVGPNSCFRAAEPRKISEVTDGASETLMVMEVDSEHAVPWMSPSDADEQLVMDIGPKSKLAHSGGVQATMADGSVHFLPDDMPATQRRALISIAGNDKVAAEGAN